MSSDKLGSIQQPVLLLGLDITEGGQRRRENVELSREELAKLITSLEAANKVNTRPTHKRNTSTFMHVLGI